jgi:hypothetical protein
MALASFRTLNSLGPPVSNSFAAYAAIADFVRPARVPGFRFGFGTGFVFFGILIGAITTFRRVGGNSLIRPEVY